MARDAIHGSLKSRHKDHRTNAFVRGLNLRQPFRRQDAQSSINSWQTASSASELVMAFNPTRSSVYPCKPGRHYFYAGFASELDTCFHRFEYAYGALSHHLRRLGQGKP